MTKTVHTSQQKFGNLGFHKAYAFKISRVNGDYVSFKVWLLGAASRIKTVAVEDIPQLLEQIDTAFAENSFVVNFPDLSFSLSEKLLCSIRDQFKKFVGANRTDITGATPPSAVFSSEKNLRSSPSNFCSIRGDSAAQALGSSANAQLTKGATRTVRGAKQISEAAAQAVCPQNPRTSSTRGERTLPARQFNNHPKNGRRSFNAGSKSPAATTATERPLRLKGRRPLRQLACANESIPSSGVRDSRRESRAVSCLREAPISRCGGVKKARRPDTEKSPKPSGVAALGNQIRTKNGRTSVVVATRKVS